MTITPYTPYSLGMLEREQAFYEAHREELRAKYAGKRVVIAEDNVLGTYGTDGEAWDETVKTRQAGSFMIKNIPLNPADETLYIAPTIQPATSYA
ncbi:hypothetical protein AGMMS49991_03990 [Spirochaetia bacterium]|nr:hypothetical protein AGMMS49991_03990 [Spirochaetia bacterium]